jgi:adenosylhomocysteinase
MMTDTTAHELALLGGRRIDWIRSRMPLLAGVRAEFRESTPFLGHRIGMSLHLEPKTAVLLETLQAGGAEIVATGNHGSTQDDIVAFLRSGGMTVFGTRDDAIEQHHANLAAVLDAGPDIILDNGADLAAGAVERGSSSHIIGGTEETTSGGVRLRGELAGRTGFPSIVINDSMLKAIGENRHGVGQSIVESFMRITNVMIPGHHFLVVGYGWCGRGIAQYLRALGGQVAIAEVDILKAFEAALDGYRVAELDELAGWADVVITATGRPDVVAGRAFDRMRSGTILANSGHFPWEIDTASLRAQAVSAEVLDDSLERIELADGRHLILIADGRMFNLAGRNPKGNSLEAMDLGFLLQALSLECVARADGSLAAGAIPVPDDVNRRAATRFLAALDAAR